MQRYPHQRTSTTMSTRSPPQVAPPRRRYRGRHRIGPGSRIYRVYPNENPGKPACMIRRACEASLAGRRTKSDARIGDLEIDSLREDLAQAFGGASSLGLADTEPCVSIEMEDTVWLRGIIVSYIVLFQSTSLASATSSTSSSRRAFAPGSFS